MKLSQYRFISTIFTVLLVLIYNTSNAKESPTLTADDKKAAIEIAALVPGIDAINVKPSLIQGLYQVLVPPQVLYISRDAKLMFYGDIIERESGKNLTTPLRDVARLASINETDKDGMIIFSPKKETKHTITVFTDIDCGYCKKLHSEITQYTDLGIEVRYLAYPRAGVNSPSYQKAVNVWCSKDRNKAITEAKLNQKVVSDNCNNPVKSHMLLAEKLGVNGTPNLVLDDGRMVPGYVPAAKLIDILDKKVALR